MDGFVFEGLAARDGDSTRLSLGLRQVYFLTTPYIPVQLARSSCSRGVKEIHMCALDLKRGAFLDSPLGRCI